MGPDDHPSPIDRIESASLPVAITQPRYQKLSVYALPTGQRRRRRQLAPTRQAPIAETVVRSDTKVYPLDRSAIANR
jgi:hypothetical protein